MCIKVDIVTRLLFFFFFSFFAQNAVPSWVPLTGMVNSARVVDG